jgi:hypothetical protein
MSERILTWERSGPYALFTATPGLTDEEIRDVPSTRFCGSEGPETIPPVIYPNDESSTVAFESWVFGTRDDEQLLAYGAGLAGQIGASLVSRETGDGS